LELIVARPAVNERNVLSEGTLDLILGLHSDTWKTRGSSKTADGLANPDAQITLMSSRAIELIAGTRDRWPEAGDQLFIDLDLSLKNLPAGTRLEIGSAVIEVTPPPHTGCHKFAARFGPDATKLVNSPEGRQLNLRGINSKVVKPGAIRVGDRVTKVRG
jgi:MOSC domain-containing protein YiiM